MNYREQVANEIKYFRLIPKELIQPLQTTFNLYVYPIGAFPLEAIINNYSYTVRDFTLVLRLIKIMINFIYIDVYTEEERNIISTFFAISANHQYQQYGILLYPFINIKSSKPEIQYCIDEIKYAYLISLIYSNETGNIYDKILNELNAIEEIHNNLNIFALKE